jgi:hypothetical protein
MNCDCGKPATITARGKDMCRSCFSISVSGTPDYRPNFPTPKTITDATICRCRHAARDHEKKTVGYASCLYAACSCRAFALPAEQQAA